MKSWGSLSEVEPRGIREYRGQVVRELQAVDDLILGLGRTAASLFATGRARG